MSKSRIKPQKLTAQDPADEVRDKLVERLGEQYKIDNIDRAILSVISRYPAVTQKEIAEAIGYSREHVSIRMNKPSFKAALNEINKSLLELLLDAQMEAIREAKRLLKSANEETRLGAIRALLAPLAKAEQQTAMPQNVIYAIKVGEGGQLVREIRPMSQSDYFLDAEAKDG